MHLADGTVANQVCVVTAAGSAAAVAYAASRVRRGVDRATLTRAAIGTAVVFGAQMVDVSVFGGAGVHLLGAALLVLVAGPALALLAMAAIVVSQAVFFNDGGVLAAGANVMNMGVVAVGTAWLVMRAVRRSLGTDAGLIAGVALASAASVFAAVAAMSAELALSGVPVRDAFTATMGAHAPFAAWETLVTTAAAAAVLAVRARAAATVRAAGRD